MKIINFPVNKIKKPWKVAVNNKSQVLLDLFVACCSLVITVAIVWFVLRHLNV